MKKILIIEDEPEMLRNVMTILRLEGYEPHSATNGKEGVDLIQKMRPDLVLCDVMMPHLDGFAVLDTIRKSSETANIPFIFLTARGEKSDQRFGMNLGADDYLTKPVAKTDLVSAIEARLKRHKSGQTRTFAPDFSSHIPLLSLGLTARVAEVLLWVAQGKTNGEIATILGISESTVKKHLLEIFARLNVETRGAATLKALEVLSTTAPQP